MHGTKFSILLTKFTTPEEVRRADLASAPSRRTATAASPPAACPRPSWHSSMRSGRRRSAILNTLLRMLNERTFENDGASVPVPLRLCVAASNEWPCARDRQGADGARGPVPVPQGRPADPTLAGRQKLLWTRDHAPEALDGDHRRRGRRGARGGPALPWSEDAVEAAELILRELAREGVQPGDRRQYKAVAAAQAYAFLGGADEVRTEHLEVLAHRPLGRARPSSPRSARR